MTFYYYEFPRIVLIHLKVNLRMSLAVIIEIEMDQLYLDCVIGKEISQLTTVCIITQYALYQVMRTCGTNTRVVLEALS